MTKKEKTKKRNIQIHSILNMICDDVWACKDAEKCKQIIIEHVEKSVINQQDKDAIMDNVRTKTTLTTVQMYFANSLLQYEGLGVIK